METSELHYHLKQRLYRLKLVISKTQGDLKRYLVYVDSDDTEGIDYKNLVRETKKDIEQYLTEVSLIETLMAHLKLAYIIPTA